MTNLVPASRPQSSPISMIAMVAADPKSIKSGAGVRAATDALEAIKQSHALFAGTYGNLWNVAPNAQIAWLVVLKDASADEIAAAAVAWVQDLTPGDDNRPRSKWPPQACDISALIQRRRAEIERRAREAKREEEKAVEIAERVMGLKASGRWESQSPSEREHLELWARRGEAVLAKRAAQSAQTPTPEHVATAAAQKRSTLGPNIATGVATIVLGLATGFQLGHVSAVREIRSDAFRVASEVRDALSHDATLTLALCAIEYPNESQK